MPHLVLDMEHAGKELLSWPQATVTGSRVGTWHNLGQWDCTLNFPEICKESNHFSSETSDSFLTSTLQMWTRKLTAWSSDDNGAYSQERQRRTERKRKKIPDDPTGLLNPTKPEAHLALAFQLYTLIKSRCYLSQFNLNFLLLVADLTLTDTSTMWYDTVACSISVLEIRRMKFRDPMWHKSTPLVSDEAKHRVLWLQNQCSFHCHMLPPWCGPRNSLFRFMIPTLSLNLNILRLYN